MIDAEQARALRSLLEQQPVAALATLHKGEPAVSMVPYALLPQGGGFVVHVSRLATHTADMQATPAVALLITAPPGSAPTPRELARTSIQGRARRCTPAEAPGEHAAARSVYLARFPDSEPIFDFADFSLFVIEPRAVRFVGGFASATTILAAEFAAVLSPRDAALPR